MLQSLNSGKFGRIADSITFNKTNKISEDNISLYHKYPDGLVIQDPSNLYRQHLGYLKQFTYNYKLGQDYMYNPRKLAEDLYGSVDLYLLLLELNGIPSPMYFNKINIIIFDPSKINILMNLIDSNAKRYKESKIAALK